ncbi:MAG TPA: OmpA family protein [Stellaceae bacterium]|nr:OmpA family protein [Stellaceae bacterium]
MQSSGPSRKFAGAATLLFAFALAGCSHVPDAVNPVAWYRDVAGTSKNDEQGESGRNLQNLEAGSTQPYPNLADVPAVPDRATGAIDREKLQQNLVADRQHAQYTNDQLQAGIRVAGSAPPPPPALAAAPNAPPSVASAGPGSAPALRTPGNPVAPPTSLRKTEEPPLESTLATPTVRSAPAGETPAPPPPAAIVTRSAPPPTPAMPPAPTGNLAALAAKAPPPVTASPPPASAAPVLQRPSLAARNPATANSAISVSVGDFTFATGSAAMSAAHRGALSEIAGLYKQAGGKLRVIGHAEKVGGDDPVQQRIAMLDLALDRANAVANALVEMGVPANEITVEAAPTRGNEIPRAEVFMLY